MTHVVIPRTSGDRRTSGEASTSVERRGDVLGFYGFGFQCSSGVENPFRRPFSPFWGGLTVKAMHTHWGRFKAIDFRGASDAKTLWAYFGSPASWKKALESL